MSKTLVIVESPAKARTISRFLGSNYQVEASYGHVRDLPENAAEVPLEFKKEKWATLGVNIDSEFEPIYIVTAEKKRRVDELTKASKGVDVLMLATDEDREGESISWHVLELLKPSSKVKVQRIVFHEITPEAIDEAIKNPRQVDLSLVKAQETRRILDRLYGYTLSPVLWKKVGPRLSAGRVQSVAVRLIVMRERERAAFISSGFASINAEIATGDGSFKARLLRLDKQKIAGSGSFDSEGKLSDGSLWLKIDGAKSTAESLAKAKPWKVTDLEKKEGVENPPVPFMTSSLQQEANRKLGFNARKTMQIAQQLYEGVDVGSGAVGLITYMRTDSLSLAARAVTEIRQEIESNYGKEYLPAKPPVFKSKAKGAQEAHEAIRPTEAHRTPASIQQYLHPDQFKLYDLIWKRTMACQMAKANVERTKVEITIQNDGSDYVFGASGKRILFPGFIRVYVEGTDDPEAELGDKEVILPPLKMEQVVDANRVEAEEHMTKPPARYTEASLVKKLEEEGVGRPSTYASIIGTIQDRNYVFKSGNQLVPTFTAYAVTELLEQNFEQLVDIQFTAKMEDQLDDIADGKRDYVDHLREFYFGSNGKPGIAEEVKQKEKEIPFPAIEIGEDIIVRVGRNGPFLQRGEGGPGNTASIPDKQEPADLTLEKAKELLDAKAEGPKDLGTDEASGRKILLKSGRFGEYLELQQTPEEAESKTKPRRVTLPSDVTANSITQEEAAILFQYPREIGVHPESKEVVVLNLGRFGPYLTSGSQSANIPDWRAAITISLEDAVLALKEGKSNSRAATPSAIKEFGQISGVEGEVKLMSGRYGPYVTNGKVNATIPKGTSPDDITPEMAAALIKERIANPPKKRVVRRRKKA